MPQGEPIGGRIGEPSGGPNVRSCLRLEIRGRVQGVGYRWSMVEEARRLGVVGWVRNRSDDSVEAVVAGTSQALDRMLSWARKGPRSAIVVSVEMFDCEGSFDLFEQRPTG